MTRLLTVELRLVGLMKMMIAQMHDSRASVCV